MLSKVHVLILHMTWGLVVSGWFGPRFCSVVSRMWTSFLPWSLWIAYLLESVLVPLAIVCASRAASTPTLDGTNFIGFLL